MNIRRAKVSSDLHDKVEALERAFEIAEKQALRYEEERDRLLELVTFLESELRRERGFV